MVDSVLAVSAAVVAVVVVANYLGDRDRSIRPEAHPYVIGDAAPRFADVTYEETDRTLLLFLRSTCRFCTESMAFYRQLASQREPGRGLRVFAVGTEGRTRLTSYLRQHGLEGVAVAEVEPRTLRMTGTPSVLMVDRSARVTGVWVGRLSSSQELEVLRAFVGS